MVMMKKEQCTELYSTPPYSPVYKSYGCTVEPKNILYLTMRYGISKTRGEFHPNWIRCLDRAQ